MFATVLQCAYFIYRFGDRNDLNFAMPERSWMFSYKVCDIIWRK